MSVVTMRYRASISYKQKVSAVKVSRSVSLVSFIFALTYDSIVGVNGACTYPDSGVDYTNPVLGGCFGPGCKVAGGYDYVSGYEIPACGGSTSLHSLYPKVGDEFDGTGEPEPDNDPLDQCNGHG
jgi:hypothetical protein